MDYTRQKDWFDPSKVNASATIVGCGGIGSFAAFALAKLGVQRLALVDFDLVDEHNVPNQMYWPDHTGIQKVSALGSQCREFGAEVAGCNRPLQDGVPMNDVMVSALDSMSARADLWEQCRMKLPIKLFIDARLGGEHIVLYSVRPTNMRDIEGYEATLHSDAEGMELPCTGRSIIDVGFVVASLITRAVRQHYAGAEPQPLVYLNQQTLDIFKGGWS